MNGAAFAGRRFDFKRPDLGARPGSRVPKLPADDRLALAEQYPKGVRFTRAGYPVFTPYAELRVIVENQIGNRDADVDAANEAAGFRETPNDFTWHHVEDGRTLELVPKGLHDGVKHTGGVAAAPGQIGHVAPGGVFTPFERRAALAGGGTGALAFGPVAAQEGGP
jgi:hypothetical protein